MDSISPEALVQLWLGEDSATTAADIVSRPLYVPYDQLTRRDGWIVWLGHPPVPDWASLLPAPEDLIWGQPSSALGVALMVTADYAVRRGATDPNSAHRIFKRESPVAVVVPGEVHHSVHQLLAQVEESGIPVVHGSPDSSEELAQLIPSFLFRSQVHAIDLGRPHDPACSFEEFADADSVGGNSLSSFIVHNDGVADGVRITGELSSKIGIEIGLESSISVDETAEIEVLAAEIPSFLSGVSSSIEGTSLRIGWRGDRAPELASLGEAFRVYLKGLLDVSLIDVTIACAPSRGTSSELSEMRARASRVRNVRAAVLAGESDPRSVSEDIRLTEFD